jgi:hypothetical protein
MTIRTVCVLTIVTIIGIACSGANRNASENDSEDTFDGQGTTGDSENSLNPGADADADSDADADTDADADADSDTDMTVDTAPESTSDDDTVATDRDDTATTSDIVTDDERDTGSDTDTDGDTTIDTEIVIGEVPWIEGTCGQASNDIGLETAEFCVTIDATSQTIRSLRPKSTPNFDFTPSDQLSVRSGPGYFHLGDLTLRLRQGAGAWQNFSTHTARTPINALPAGDGVLAAANLAPVMSEAPVEIVRSWTIEGGRLGLRFEIVNTSDTPVEIGALGIPMIFNNYLSERTLEEAHDVCVFSDPYIGMDAGYLQVTRLNGAGPALIVYPERGTPFEAYNPILNPPNEDSMDPPTVFTDPTPRNNTFEGFYEWMAHSLSYQENEWQGSARWHPATSITLNPSESRTFGLKFVLAEDVRHIEQTLTRDNRPVAVGIPGTILPMDVKGALYLDYAYGVRSMTVSPAGALTVEERPVSNDYKAFTVRGEMWGRSRLTVTYTDDTVQTIHYYVTKPAHQVLKDMGHFLTTEAWFTDMSDHFGRAPSVMTYDKETGSVVTQWKQAWVAGLGDDGGATWLAGAMKLFGQPDAKEVAQYQQFVDGVVWGNLQYASGDLMYGVKRTLFYYEPGELPADYYDASIDWSYWGAWRRAHTEQVSRSYNYPHPTALYWTLYRLARNYKGLVDNHSWEWYLNQAYRTALAMTDIGDEYARFGLMNGSVFLEVLKDLYREGMNGEAAILEGAMQARANVWAAQAYPFGSEMPWDSTGQEEVYQWSKYFGHDDKADVCVRAVLAYMPTMPHWGYNGCARRYWDFKYGGSKTDRLERMIHHYGSSLNAIPVLSEFRERPDDFYLLRVGYAGMMGTLTNIDQQGFPSMAFHAFPDIMDWDPRTGDVGLALFGHTYNTATYLVNHPDFGWHAFGGNVDIQGTSVAVTPLDSFGKRFYIAPAGLWLTLDAGVFDTVSYNMATGAVNIDLAPADDYTQNARLRIEQPAAVDGVGTYEPEGYPVEREAYVIPLGDKTTRVTLN